MPAPPIRILCVDDHPLMAQGIQAALLSEPDLEIVGELNSTEHLLTEALSRQADVVLLDIAVPGPDPFTTAADLHRTRPETKTVFLSAHLRDRYLDAAFAAHAWGYLYKGDKVADIVDAIRRVADGEYVFSPRVQERLRSHPARRPGARRPPASRLTTLTATETQVLRLIGRGLPRDRIAKALHRSVKTIDTHRAAIMQKLDIHDRTELALFAVREGLVDSE